MQFTKLEVATLTPGKSYHVVGAAKVTRNGVLKPGKNAGEAMEFVKTVNSGAEARAQGLVPMSNKPKHSVFMGSSNVSNNGKEEVEFYHYPGSYYVKNASSGGKRKTRKTKRSKRKTQRRRR
jgi:hypothetical protein